MKYKYIQSLSPLKSPKLGFGDVWFTTESPIQSVPDAIAAETTFQQGINEGYLAPVEETKPDKPQRKRHKSDSEPEPDQEKHIT
jgi:hypothetical protein